MRQMCVGLLIGAVSLAIAATDSGAADTKKVGCEALIEFMKKGRTIVQSFSGAERAKRLDELKRTYTDRMKSAPQKAKAAAASYLRHVEGYLDGKTPDIGSQILIDRNTALKACGTTPSKAGF